MSKKHKNVCTILNYNEHFLVLASTITGSISILAFTSLFGILIRITSFSIGLKMCAIASRIKKHRSIVRKKRKRDKIVSLGRYN